MYHVPNNCYTKAHLCELKMLWVKAGLEVLEEIAADALEEAPPEDDNLPHDNNAPVRVEPGGHTVVGNPSPTLAEFVSLLRKEKRRLKNWVPTSRALTIIKEEKQGKQISFDRAPFRLLLGEMKRDSFIKYPYYLAAAIASYHTTEWAEVMERLKNNFIRALNSRPWERLVRAVSAPSGENYRVEMQPVNAGFHATFAAWGNSGFASMSPRLTVSEDKVEQYRATNLWHSRFIAEDGDRLLFECFRSGTLAYPFGDAEELRKPIAESKARELLKAMLLRHLEKLGPAEREQVLGGEVVPRIPAVCINLQSAASRGTEEMNELEPVRDHVDALLLLNGKEDETYAIIWEGHPVTVHAIFDIAIFNFGVNAAGAGMIAVIAGGRAYREVTNARALATMEEFYESFRQHQQEKLDALMVDGTVDEMMDANKLATLSKKLFDEIQPGCEGAGDTTYKTAALVTNLAHLIGCQVHFNCKSGKDRTSVCALESHFVAWKIHETGKLPVWANHLKGADKLMHRRLIFESGNLELQARNTGIPGYKIVPAVPVVKIIFEGELKERFGKYLVVAQGLCREAVVDTKYTKRAYKKYREMTRGESREYASKVATL